MIEIEIIPATGKFQFDFSLAIKLRKHFDLKKKKKLYPTVNTEIRLNSDFWMMLWDDGMTQMLLKWFRTNHPYFFSLELPFQSHTQIYKHTNNPHTGKIKHIPRMQTNNFQNTTLS